MLNIKNIMFFNINLHYLCYAGRKSLGAGFGRPAQAARGLWRGRVVMCAIFMTVMHYVF